MGRHSPLEIVSINRPKSENIKKTIREIITFKSQAVVTHNNKTQLQCLENTLVKQQAFCGQTWEATVSVTEICCLPKVRQTKILSFYGLKLKTKSISYF